jgi:hypothetical protein
MQAAQHKTFVSPFLNPRDRGIWWSTEILLRGCVLARLSIKGLPQYQHVVLKNI